MITRAPGPGRPRRYFTVRRIRLIGFHNFVNEIIEVRDGGHLFLLGDNGSGKTTVLDAVHYVLSGGQDLELNAAARIGGRRDEGRTMQGVVLRFDTERGVMNEGGGIAYAVVELIDSDGRPFCVGVGTEGTTMEARLTRWGVFRDGPLEELPLLTPEGAPTPRDRFRELLAKPDTFGRIEDYRRAVAERLFGGAALYEEVCRFWSMAKAYREIVAGARDFETLFRRLLPVPNAQVFEEILRSLRQIDDMEVALRDIEQQRDYVGGLVLLGEDVNRHREAMARYDWLLKLRRLEAARDEATRTAERIESLGRQLEDAATEVETAEAHFKGADAALRGAETAEGATLLVALHAAEAAQARTAAEARGLAAAADRANRDEAAAAADRDGALGAWRARLIAATEELDLAITACVELPGDLPASRTTLASARAAAEPGAPSRPPDVEAAFTEVDAVREAAEAEADHRRREATELRGAAHRARALVSALEQEHEEMPQIAGFPLLRSHLASRSARPLYELLVPRPGASPGALASVEALAGDETLGALIAPPAELNAMRTLTQAEAPQVRVVVRTAGDVDLPAWIADLFEEPDDELDALAHRALATALAQPGSLGPVAQPTDGTSAGAVELRGAAWHRERPEPRLLGVQARERAHQERLAAAHTALAAAEGTARAAEEQAGTAAQRVRRLQRIGHALAALVGPGLAELHHRVQLKQQALDFAMKRAGEARDVAETAQTRAKSAAAEHSALLARTDPARLAELKARLHELRMAVEGARTAWGEKRDRKTTIANALDKAAGDQRTADASVTSAETALAAAAIALRSHLPSDLTDDAALDRYVRKTKGGDQFRSTDAIAEAHRTAERDEQRATDELAGDGSRGVRFLVHAGRFGFTYDRPTNRIEDRRGQPAPGILAQIDQTLAEQREVVNTRTRELMDTLVMGTLARHLQEQVDQLSRMVRDINRLLEGIRFGQTTYQFQVNPRTDRRELVEMVKSIALVDEDSRRRFRAWIDERLPEVKAGADDGVPELLDYRRWYDYRLRMRSLTAEGVDLPREIRALGSGGEQGVPNYLLVLALAKLMFDNSDARVRPLLFDEAFYGIDAGRRDQLLRFATELGLQLLVASPDQDGVTPSVRHATTLFVVKDQNCDVHLAPYHYWNRGVVAQRDLFDTPPAEPPPDEAECRIGDEAPRDLIPPRA